MKVIKNFLEEREFHKLKNSMLNPWFPWFHQDGTTYVSDGTYQLTHTYCTHGTTNSPHVNKLDYLLDKLNVDKLERAKVNYQYRERGITVQNYHIDFPNITTAILYMNTNNGYTKFKNGDISPSVENTLVMFDSNLEHAGTTCTDAPFRVVLNLNFTIKK